MKRFIPAGLFGALALTIIFQIAEKLNWWEIKETIFPLTDAVLAFGINNLYEHLGIYKLIKIT